MNEEKLKELLQAMLDGKDIEVVELSFTGGVISHLRKEDTLAAKLEFIHDHGFNYGFRIKLDVKVFKYKIRPYECVCHSGETKLGVWHSQVYSETETEQAFERIFDVPNSHKSFKWLAPATAHEVIYE